MIKEYPWVGCGLGGYEGCFAKYQTVAPMNTIDYAHNDYLQAMAELGVPAMAAGVALLVLLLRAAMLAWLGREEGEGRWVALGCAGAMAAMLLHSFTDFNLYIPANAMALAWIAGMAGRARSGVEIAVEGRWERVWE